ncbi:MAG: dihydrodipicolinate synthase family protein [Intrasporangiaceae bacterium]|nr:dihydrodipicolinate synthase family protein [Intrasporangiaceae bacterium]
MSVTAPLGHGVWGILATPFHGPDRAVDTASFARQIELYRRIGATGVVALGVFGEAIKLSADEQRTIVGTAVAAAGELPVVVGLSGLSTAPVLDQARVAVEAADGHLAGVMVQVNDTDPGIVADHLRTVHDATGLGIVVQDYPATSGVRIATSALLEVVAATPFAVAIKAESPPTSIAVDGLSQATDLPVFGGLGGVGLLDELAAGAAGAMTGFSHPEGLVAAVEAYRTGGFAAARDAFAPWLPIANFEAQAGIQLALRKEILRRRGIIDDAAIRRPGRELPSSLAPLLDQHLAAAAELLASGG